MAPTRFGGRSAAALLLLCLLLATPASAQNTRFDVRGVVADSSGAGLPGATVVALTQADSILTKFATTGGSGAFTLRRLPAGAYILQVTFVGYQTLRQDFNVAEADVDLGTVPLAESVSALDELVVSADHIPFVIKRDTLDYNANAFATRPNANVEDLLRRLPGIEVETDGTITAQGETVQNVLVDGKEFFGSDPTIATKNLPADAIERVQVYDKQSDQAEFTGIPDGEEEKTINLSLKDDAKRGLIGNVTGGFGGAQADVPRYDAQANINRFTSGTQLSLIANINNVNRPGFAWRDFLNFLGGFQAFQQQGGRDGAAGGLQIGTNLSDGFAETLSLGFNASRDFGAKSWIRSSYFVSRLDNQQDRAVLQQQLLGEAVSSFVSQTSNQASDNLTHRLNLNAQATLAEGHDLRLRANLSASTSSLTTAGFQETRDATGLTQNTALANYATEGDNLGGNTQLTWRKRLSENGRSLVGIASATLNDADRTDHLSSITGIAERGDVRTYEELVQEQLQRGQTFSHTQRLALTQPLGRGRTLEVFGERSALREDQTRDVFDVTPSSSLFNDLLSTGFEQTYTYLRSGLQFSRNTETRWIGLGANLQVSDLAGTVQGRDAEMTNGYTHLLPWANIRVAISEGRTVRLRYTTRTREPSMIELQPFTDNSDPLNLYIGNPDLTPEYWHTVNADYRFFDQFSFVNLFVSAGGSYLRNPIVRSRTVAANFSQAVTPVNAGRGWTANTMVHFGMPIRPISARLNLSNGLVYSTGSEFINALENESRILRNTINVALENRDKSRFDARTSVQLTFNQIDYSLNDFLNQRYINSTYSASGSYYLTAAWTLESQLDYRVFDADVFGQGQNVALWRASISYLLANERTEVELGMRDLLNQNQAVNFTNAATYIQEERIETLGRYVMLKLVHRLSGPGGSRGGGR